MMNNIILKQLLNEYEQTRLQNIKDLDARKKEIYSKKSSKNIPVFTENFKNQLSFRIKEKAQNEIKEIPVIKEISDICEILEPKQSEENEKHRNFLLKALGFAAIFFLGLFGIKNRNNKL